MAKWSAMLWFCKIGYYLSPDQCTFSWALLPSSPRSGNCAPRGAVECSGPARSAVWIFFAHWCPQSMHSQQVDQVARPGQGCWLQAARCQLPLSRRLGLGAGPAVDHAINTSINQIWLGSSDIDVVPIRSKNTGYLISSKFDGKNQLAMLLGPDCLSSI